MSRTAFGSDRLYTVATELSDFHHEPRSPPLDTENQEYSCWLAFYVTVAVLSSIGLDGEFGTSRSVCRSHGYCKEEQESSEYWTRDA